MEMQTCYRHPDEPAGIVCQRCDRPICPKCMHQASVGFHCPECVKSGKQKVIKGPAAFVTQPIITQVLIAINVAVFAIGVAMEGTDAISGEIGRLHIDYGLIAKFTYQGRAIDGAGGVGDGEWYRMITSGFLHYGALHLLLNMYALWILGRAVEHMMGRLRFAVIYGVALCAGSLGALIVSPGSVTAGASGAIYGLMGAILLIHRSEGIPFRNSPLLGVLVINFLFTLGFPGISVGGHLGGFAGGALAGWILADVARRPNLDKRLPFVLCGAAAFACLVAGVIVSGAYTG